MFETGRTRRERAREAHGALSAREREVLELLAAGSTNADIAGRLYLSNETIKSHVRNAMLKLGARTRTHAVVLALQRGDLELPSGPPEQADLELRSRRAV
jgi:two-component system NarL family response regulator